MPVAATATPNPPTADEAFTVTATGLTPGRWYEQRTTDAHGTQWNGNLLADPDGHGTWPCQPIRYPGTASIEVILLPKHGHQNEVVATLSFAVA